MTPVPARLLLAAVALWGLACTDASLYGYDKEPVQPNKLVLSGDLCTEDPTERGFPVKVLFLVDTSLADKQPECTTAPAPGCYGQQRADSVQKVIRTFGGPNYTYGVIRYASALKGTPCGLANLTPDGYTRVTTDAVAALRCADPIAYGRDIMSALSLASSFITGDVLQTPKGLRARTKYVVVLLAYGAPTQTLSSLWCNSQNPKLDNVAPVSCPDGSSGTGCTCAYTDKFCGDMEPPPADCERALYVEMIRDMKAFAIDNGAQELWLHSIYQRDPGYNASGTDDVGAISLLTDLAIAGEGSLYTYPTGARPTAAEATGACPAGDSAAVGCLYSPINFDSTQSVYLRKELLVANRNAQPTPTGIKVDSDGDGLPDELELEIGTDPQNADTDGDMLSDRLEYLMRSVGLDPLRTNLPPCNPKGTPPATVGGCCPAGGCPVTSDPPPVCYCAPDCDVDGAGNVVMRPDCVDPNATPESLAPWPAECPLPQTYLPNAFAPDLDTDGDGLTDCEEMLIRTESTLLDTDADGMPDILEFKYGTNALASDSLGDLDTDGSPNGDEIRWHTDPLAKDLTLQGKEAYRYHFTDTGEREMVSFSQPTNVTGVVIQRASNATTPGPARLLFVMPGECGNGQPTDMSLIWIDPGDVTAATAGTGSIDPCGSAFWHADGTVKEASNGLLPPDEQTAPLVTAIPADGEYVVHSISSKPGMPEGELSITVRVISVLLPTVTVQDTIRLSSSKRFCFNFRASNITLLQTLPDANGDTWNYIDVFLAEVPKNNASSYGVFRVATIPIIYSKDPPRRQPEQGEIVLTFDDFLPLGE
ncbi:MAG: hypothetical protein HY906_17120 [Deltaproteobacteria bacterium]|nr:hypothetical protein [Deltaproteobacteria bacterium]